MEKYKKFIQKLPKSLRLKAIKALYKLAEGDLKGLDIKELSGPYEIHRCRIGKIRIIFQKKPSVNMIMDIGFRGGVYKNC
ncbi:type II toxin-antitoxin system RelE/ParE family toxin [Patescibacteria group bacterium]|nr:type II toxin-antitoxin system RelE/ParE family toxin [Patescibacteria group bacterium]